MSKTCDVLDYGAKGDSTNTDIDETKAIQAAIDDIECSTVLLPIDKVFVTGSLFLKSNLIFQVDGNLQGSKDYKNKDLWPEIYTRRGGLMVKTTASLINGGQCLKMKEDYIPYPPYIHGDQCETWNILENVQITSSSKGNSNVGSINGNGDCGWASDDKTKNNRPTMLGLGHINGLTINNIYLTNPAFWTLHVLFCDGVHISNIEINTSSDTTVGNADGIDPDSSSNVVIDSVKVTSNDDVIAIKSGINEDGRAVGIPSSNIQVINSYFESGHGLSIGSETSGDIRDVMISNNIMNGTERGIRIKSQAGRGGIVERITYENLNLIDIQTAVSITMEYTDDGHGQLPTFRDITLKNIQGNNIQEVGELVCEKNSVCTNMTFKDINLQIKEDGEDEYDKCQYIEGSQENVVPEILCLNN